MFFLAKRVPENGVIVEIGTYKGGSAICLAKGTKARVYAVDPHQRSKKFKAGPENFPKNSLPYFNKNIKKFGVKDKISPIIKTSAQAAKKWDKPINLLWLDGDHDYEAVRKDFLLWEKYLVTNGIIALHDTCRSKNICPITNTYIPKLEGPARVVKKYLINSGRFKKIKVVDSITFTKKIKNRNCLEIIKDYLVDPILIITEKNWQLIKKEVFAVYKKIDCQIGLVGIWLQKKCPRLYYLIKKMKG